MIIMVINLFIYFTIQPLSFIYLFVCLRKQSELVYINNFLKSVSFISFLTMTCYLISDIFCRGLCVPLYKLLVIDFNKINESGLYYILMIYSWFISASYFVLYFFNKENKLGIYIYMLLFIMFVFVLFETVYRYLQNW